MLSALLFASVSLVACGGDDDGPTGDDDDDVPQVYSHYVNDTVTVPQVQAEVTTYGLDVDGDGRPENALGGVLVALKGQAQVAIQPAVDSALVDGQLIILHSLLSANLTADANAKWGVYLGVATDAPPKYDGTDTFTVQPDSLNPTFLDGELSGGTFEGGPGDLTIQLALTEGIAPIKIKVTGGLIHASVNADGCSDGILAGAITETELQSSVIPGVAALVNASVNDDSATGTPIACTMANDPVCVDAPSGDPTACDTDRDICITASTKTVLGLLDANKDGEVSADEIRTNGLIQTLLSSDVDLLDASGNFQAAAADRDGVKDSLSLGLGFSCKKATFDAPNEN